MCKLTTISDPLQAPPRILPFEIRNFDFRLWVSSMWVIRNSRPKLKGVAVYFEQLHEGPPAILYYSMATEPGQPCFGQPTAETGFRVMARPV